MALATIGIIASIAGTATSLASLGYSAAQGAPEIPSGSAAARNISQAQAAALPTQRALAALQQQGGKFAGTKSTMTRGEIKEALSALQKAYKAGGKSDGAIQSQIQTLKQVLRTAPTTPGVKPSRDAKGGDRLYDKFDIYKDNQGNVVPREIGTADFTGYGTADVEGELARQFSDIELELGQKYGTQFAEEARKASDLANPEGAKARKMQFDLLQEELANPRPINPLSQTLEDQIQAELKAGRGLDPMSRELLDAAVARANADRGGSLAAGDVSTSMSTGMEGQNRLDRSTDKAQAFLNSGSSPADIQYRRDQQTMANMGDFVSGTTPQSQFGNISGSGAAPFVRPAPGPTMPGGAAALGQNYAGNAYRAQVGQAMQPNPWLGGISAMLSSVGGLTKAIG